MAGSAPGGFAGLKERLARSAAGLGAIFSDEAVREKAGSLLHRSVRGAVERGQAGVRGALKAVLAKVAAADAARRGRGEEESTTVDLQVGARLYEDVPRYMRTQLWLSLLDQQEATVHSSTAGGAETLDDMDALICEGDYYESLVNGLVAAAASGEPGAWAEDVGAIIGRDLSRTFPHHPQFQEAAGRAGLQRVLHAYALHDPACGYCQGMAFVAGSLLMYLEEGRAFAALVTLMHSAGLRALYLPGMAGLQLRLRQLEELLRRRSPALAAHLEAHEVSPVIYASSWLLTCYAAEFPPPFTARLLDVALAERSASVVLRVALALLDAAEEALLALAAFEDLVLYIKVELKTLPPDRLRDILTLGIAMPGLDDAALQQLAAELEAADGAAASPAEEEAEAEAVVVGEAGPSPGRRMGHSRSRSKGSSAVLDLLQDLELCSLRGEEGEEGWVEVQAPLGGGIGTASPAPPAGLASGLARPSLGQLAREALPGERSREGDLMSFGGK